MSAVVFVVSLFLVMGDASAVVEVPLRVLGEVISGPARGRPLALYLDSILPAHMWREVEGLEAVRGMPHVIYSFGHSSGWQEAAASGAVLRDSFHTLHVLLWVKPRPDLLLTLCYHWQPRSLLLLTLGPSPDTAVLLHEVLGGVDRLALIARLSAGDDTLGVYTALPFSRNVVRLLGPWRRESFTVWEALFPDRFSSFEGYTFQLASDFRDPLYLYSTVTAPEVGRGTNTRLLDAMASKLNYSYTLTQRSPDLKWGVIENGSWVGLLGTIIRKEKNFTVNSFYINEERTAYFDPSVSVGEGRIGVFLPSPQPLPEWLSLVRPFNPVVWVFLLLAVALAMVLMATMERESARRSVTHRRNGKHCVWQGLPRATVAQSAPAVPETLWQRVFLTTWLLGCLVMTAAFTCDLVRIFTRVTYPNRLQTLWDVVDSHYRVAVVINGAYLEKYVRHSPEPVFVRMRQKMDFLDKITDAVTILQKGHHAHLSSELHFKLRLMKTIKEDEWYIMGERIHTGPLFWYFPKNTPWKATFDSAIRKLQYFGLIDHWLEMEFAAWVKDNVDRSKLVGSSGRESNPAQPLSLWHLQGVFYIVGISWLVGCVALLLEVLWAHTHQN